MRHILAIFLIFAIVINADTIHFKKGGSQKNLEVISETYKNITYKVKSGELTQESRVSSESVNWVEYSDAPIEFYNGFNEVKKNNYRRAIEFLQDAMEIAERTRRVRNWITQYGLFYIGLSYQRIAEINPSEFDKINTAIEYYNKLIREIPDTRFLFNTYLNLANCYFYKGNIDESKKVLKIIIDKAENLDKSKIWALKAFLFEVKILIKEENHLDALNESKKAARFATKIDALQDEANLLIGDVYIAKKDYTSAINHFKQIKAFAKKDNIILIAGIENGIAESYLAKKEYNKARRIAAKNFINYVSAGEQHAKSLYILGECSEKIGDKESLKKAKIYYEFLKNSYPNTEWGRKASRKLLK